MPVRKSTQRKRRTRRLATRRRRLRTPTGVARRGGSLNRSLMTPDQEREYETVQIRSLTNEWLSARGRVNQIKAAENFYSFILTTNYLLQNDRFRNQIKAKIAEFEAEPHISPRLTNLLMATKQYITNFE